MQLHRWGVWIVTMLLALSTASPATAVLSEEDIPPALAPWRDWVLHGHEEELCPTDYDNAAVARCRWPSRLSLDIDRHGGRFEQIWVMLARGWVPLPGEAAHWPDAVAVNGRSAAVIDRDGRPMVFLSPGEHRIEGRFFWNRTPETIHVPPSLGLVSLAVEGRQVRSPRFDEQGRLWLAQAQASTREGREQHRLQVFRLFSDTIPMRMTTLLKLEISGPGRELHFENILMTNGIAMRLESPLPARLEPGGRLVVQARPGQWDLRILSRFQGPINKIEAGAAPFDNEVWSFQPQHHLRMVELSGLSQLEPGRTEMPPAWHAYPAFQVRPNGVLTLKEVSRGDADPAPDRLRLNRTWWLDFDGKGFTVHDRLSGTLSRSWALVMRPPMELGRVAVDGEDRVITRQGPQGEAGVEVRHGRLDLQADSRLPARSGRLSALGWGHDMEQVAAVLNIPPGWRLLGATGVDHVSHSWLQQWSLLDFFLVLIIALAVFKLRSWPWGLVALVAMVLVFHEPGAPRLVWLHLLAVIALLPLLPSGGWLRRWVILWGIGAGVTLVVIMVPFWVNQLRWSVYPQLAPAYVKAPSMVGGTPRKALRSMPAPAPQSEADEVRVKRVPSVSSLSMSEAEPQMPAVWQNDPHALIPTGPGLPDWQWQSVALTWNGPVAKDQRIRFILLGPVWNFFLCLLRVGLLAALTWGLFDWRPWWQKVKPHLGSASMVMLAMLALAAADGRRSAQAAETETAGFPPPALLEEFRQRLLEKPDCMPRCADISRMEVTVSGNGLQIMLKVHAAQLTAVPLPVNRKSWTPNQVLLDNAPISGLSRDAQGQLWALVSAGLHTVVLVGDITGMEVLHFPLPLRPHMAAFSAPGWDVKGVQPDGGVGASIQMIRLQGAEDAGDAAGAVHDLPPFLHVKRHLALGLSWQVTTTVTRVTPIGAPIVVSIPLLTGESVITEGLTTARGEVLITLAAEQQHLIYQSALEQSTAIKLEAPRSIPWTETWVLDAAPIWHCNLSGITPIHIQDRDGAWQPQWQPWPGEQVQIGIQRPSAIEGRQVTIDRGALNYLPGQRFARGDLSLRVRTSHGQPFSVELPPKANLQQVTVNGRSLPIRQDGAYVTIPLEPGSHNIAVQWHQPASVSLWLKTPAVNLGQPAVNAHVTIKMPSNRWILMVGGPRWGPAVLFWSYLVVILIVAYGLGRFSLTPLPVWKWMLLGLGLTQIPPLMAMVIVGWLMVLALRERRTMPGYWLSHNLVQVGLVLWTLAALVCLFLAVKAGLVGQPDMQIQGNQSYSLNLHWTQDRIDTGLPQPWVLSLPLWTYRLLMLAWSLWLAWSLLGWLKWGWHCFSREAPWRKRTPKRSTGVSTGPTPDTGVER